MNSPGTGIVCPLSSLVWWQLEQGRGSGYIALLSSDQKEQLNFNHTFYTDMKSLMGNSLAILKGSHKLANNIQQYQWFLYQSHETVATTIERFAMLYMSSGSQYIGATPGCRSGSELCCCCGDEVTIRAWLELYAELTMMPMKICNHVDIVDF